MSSRTLARWCSFMPGRPLLQPVIPASVSMLLACHARMCCVHTVLCAPQVLRCMPPHCHVCRAWFVCFCLQVYSDKVMAALFEGRAA